MQEEPNPVKDYLFDYISKSEKQIEKLISDKKFSEIIDDVIANCYDKIITLEERDESIGILATGLLHYLLTNALINTQRKIVHQGIEIDIVIPDIKTLEKDPKKALLICIPKSTNKNVIEEKISQLEKIQPEKENIWVVLSENISINKKSFVISKEDNSFSKIIFEIAQFSNVNDTNKFKILRV